MTYEEIKNLKLRDVKIRAEFLDEVRRDLQITWEDIDTDTNLANYIKDGAEVLENDVGTCIDFDEDEEARGLLRTYVRYAYNKSEEFFIENNLSRLLKLEVKYGKD